MATLHTIEEADIGGIVDEFVEAVPAMALDAPKLITRRTPYRSTSYRCCNALVLTTQPWIKDDYDQ